MCGEKTMGIVWKYLCEHPSSPLLVFINDMTLNQQISIYSGVMTGRKKKGSTIWYNAIPHWIKSCISEKFLTLKVVS